MRLRVRRAPIFPRIEQRAPGSSVQCPCSSDAQWGADGLRRVAISRNCTRILSDFKRCASGSERERPCARILRKFRENTVAPYATLPYTRASKAHRPTKPNLQKLQNLLNYTFSDELAKNETEARATSGWRGAPRTTSTASRCACCRSGARAPTTCPSGKFSKMHPF